MADTNTAALAYIEESTYGTTPASALQTLRFTGESLADQEATVESAEILSDRMLRAVRSTGRWMAGEINGELSAATLDTLLEGVLAGAWSSNVLENGTTKKSYTFEKSIAVSSSPSTHYLAYKGCRLDTLSLSFELESLIGYRLGVVGKAGANATATAGSGAYTAAGTTEPFSVTQLTAITEASADPGDVTSISLNVSNNLRRQMALGSSSPTGYGYGGFRADGQLVMYFDNFDLYDKYEAETLSELEWTVTDSASKSYTFTVPKARWGPGQVLVEGINGDITASFPWQATRDATTGSMLYITRVP